jgi:hypothetical protein
MTEKYKRQDLALEYEWSMAAYNQTLNDPTLPRLPLPTPPKPIPADVEEKFQADAERFKNYMDFTPYHTLLPEQLALMDLFIARYAPCFCSAHLSSTFSYWVQRMKALSQRKHLHIAEVNVTNYGIHWIFAGWGV